MSVKVIIAVGIIASCSIPAQAVTPLCQALMRSSQAEVDKALSLIEAGADVNETCGSVRDFRPLDLVINQVSQKFDVVAEAMIKRRALVGGAYPDNITFPSPERRTEFEAYLKDRQQSSFAMSPSEIRYSIAKHRGDMRAAQDASNAEYIERATRKQNETLRAVGQAALIVGGTLVATKIAGNSTPATTAQALPNIQRSASSGTTNTAQASSNARPSVIGSLQSAGNTTADGATPRPLYVTNLSRAFSGTGKSETEGCAAADGELKRGPNAYLTGKVLEFTTTGPCSCKHVLEPGFGPARPAVDYYRCEIPYMARVESASDPSASPQTGPSRNTSR